MAPGGSDGRDARVDRDRRDDRADREWREDRAGRDDRGAGEGETREAPAPPSAGPRFVRDRYDVVRTYATLGSVGLAFVFAVVIGTGIGLWLDRLTGWSPACTMIFFVLGLSAGIVNVYRTVSRLK